MLNGQDLNLTNLSVSNTATLENIVSNNDVTVNGDLSVVGDAVINGDLTVSADFNTASGIITNLTSDNITNNATISTNNLTVTDNINTANTNITGTVLANDLTVTNNTTLQNLVVNGSFSAPQTTQMEIVYFNVTGNATSVSLNNNATNTTDYSVFPSVYYGYTGSSGTYNFGESAGAITGQIAITDRTYNAFTFCLNKSDGNNVNVYIVFLVIYNVESSDYPSSYT